MKINSRQSPNPNPMTFNRSVRNSKRRFKRALRGRCPKNLKRYFFTFGTDLEYPYVLGYIEVRAKTRNEAIEKYQYHHPNRPGSHFVNCAGIYNYETFAATTAYEMEKCHEVIM